jgi:glycogen synthase
MRLLHASATYAPFIGGAETYLRAVSERLVADGHSVDVTTTDAAEVEAFWNPRKRKVESLADTINGVDVQRARLRHLPFSPLSFYLFRRLVVETAGLPGAPVVLRRCAPLMPWVPGYAALLASQARNCDLVHGINIALEWPLIAAWRYARKHGLPFVATPFVHAGEPGRAHVSRNYTMPHQMEVLRDADAVIVQTGIEAAALAELGVSSDRIHILGMGVDIEAACGGDARRFCARYGLADGPIVLFMGVITKDKGAVHLVEAMRQLWANALDATLVLVGNPVDEFEAYWNSLPGDTQKRIIRTGVLMGQEKKDALAAATVFALPSRIDSFGIVFLEAWANGRAVIGARAGGIPAVVDEGKDGLLATYGDVPALASAIRQLLADEPLRTALGAAGRSKVEQCFTWDRICKRLTDIYAAARIAAAQPGSQSH